MTATRFAPSPTGALHLGNIRTALFNALIARAAGGDFILRLDDTDPARCEDRFVAAIERDLAWLGLAWDRRARQSEHLALYQGAAETLKAAGRLYPCWETPEDLALRRRARRAAGRPPVYDRAALRLSRAETARLWAERAPHWRFLLGPEPIRWPDGVRGWQEIDPTAVSDPVLIREDGQFLYALCSVADDVELGVTDIVRGADHVTNTAIQLQIFGALGAAPPRFAHHALVAGPDGEKLSKRAGGLTVAELREAGVEPEAVLSYLARIGSSSPVEPIRSVEEAAAGFDIASFGLSPTRVSADEIAKLSASMLRAAPYEAVADRLPGVSPAFWAAVRPNIDRLSDARDWARIAEEGAIPKIAPDDEAFVAQALSMLPPRPWSGETWSEWTGAVQTATGRRGGALYRPLRRALTGRDRGPEMAALMPHLRHVGGRATGECDG